MEGRQTMKKYKLMKILPYLLVAAICLHNQAALLLAKGTSANSLIAQRFWSIPMSLESSRLTAVPVTRITCLRR